MIKKMWYILCIEAHPDYKCPDSSTSLRFFSSKEECTDAAVTTMREYIIDMSHCLVMQRFGEDSLPELEGPIVTDLSALSDDDKLFIEQYNTALTESDPDKILRLHHLWDALEEHLYSDCYMEIKAFDLKYGEVKPGNIC